MQSTNRMILVLAALLLLGAGIVVTRSQKTSPTSVAEPAQPTIAVSEDTEQDQYRSLSLSESDDPVLLEQESEDTDVGSLDTDAADFDKETEKLTD